MTVWLPPVLLMAVIYVLSDQPNLGSGLGVVDLIARKLVHMAEFAALTALWWRALRTKAGQTPALIAAAGVAMVYAVTDEIHQTFVLGRSGSAWDAAIDAIGVATACALVARRLRRREQQPV